MLDTVKIRGDFPQLERVINHKPIIYLDSTATSLKPRQVLAKMNEYYTQYTANVFRGIYITSEEATAAYESARESVARFLNTKDPREIVFTRNTTESINLVAKSWGEAHINSGDEIVMTIMEHHSNFVPWQQLAQKKQAKIKIWDLNKNYELDLLALDTLVTRRTKVLAITAASNVLGTIVPVEKIINIVRKKNPQTIIVVDAAQAAAHNLIDVRAWDADFVAFSAHKMLGPTGVGVLWGKYEHLSTMDPYQYGGEMIDEVHITHTLFKDPPHKFEAGTPNISGVIGTGAAAEYLMKLGMKNVREHEKTLVTYALSQFKKLPYLHVVGPDDASVKAGVVAFTMDGVHPHDIAQVLDEDNIYVRAGNHCAMPLHEWLGLAATARASFYMYTTKADIDALVDGLVRIHKLFS